MKKLYGIYGCAGMGRETYPLIKAQLEKSQSTSSEYEIVYIDDGGVEPIIKGTPVYNFQDFLNQPAEERFATIAIAESHLREKLTANCTEAGVQMYDVRAENVLTYDNVQIGEGSLLCPFVTLTTDIQIGRGFHANIYSYVAHDCIIGDFVTFAPRVNCNGNIIIEDYAYIGTGAVIKQGAPGRPLRIGKGAVVGAGAVVTKNVPPGITVFSNPAVPLTEKNLEIRRDRE